MSLSKSAIDKLFKQKSLLMAAFERPFWEKIRQSLWIKFSVVSWVSTKCPPSSLIGRRFLQPGYFTQDIKYYLDELLCQGAAKQLLPIHRSIHFFLCGIQILFHSVGINLAPGALLPRHTERLKVAAGTCTQYCNLSKDDRRAELGTCGFSVIFYHEKCHFYHFLSSDINLDMLI